MPFFSGLYQNLILNLKNIPGWRTSRKIVVIECDDWGGIRVPSKLVYNTLLRAGLPINKNRYRFDTLATSQDLKMLFDVLNSAKDKNGHSAVVTPITNVANPDFEKIKTCGFANYHYEKFTDTLKRYYPDDDVFKMWLKGLAAGIFVPELHGREHITVQMWLQKLKEGNKDLLIAFNHGFVSLDVPGIPLPAREFRAEFYFTSEEQKPFLFKAIKDSVALFKEIFGYLPRMFVPGNGIFHPDFDGKVAEAGVKYLYVSHYMPYPVNRGELKYRRFIIGQKGPGGLTYYTRNCAFEPTGKEYRSIDLTIRQVAAAFRWGKLANISTHRVNFVGGINSANREKGLSELQKLLEKIVSKWPDVEFLSSGDALESLKISNK